MRSTAVAFLPPLVRLFLGSSPPVVPPSSTRTYYLLGGVRLSLAPRAPSTPPNPYDSVRLQLRGSAIHSTLSRVLLCQVLGTVLPKRVTTTISASVNAEKNHMLEGLEAERIRTIPRRESADRVVVRTRCELLQSATRSQAKRPSPNSVAHRKPLSAKWKFCVGSLQ